MGPVATARAPGARLTEPAGIGNCGWSGWCALSARPTLSGRTAGLSEPLRVERLADWLATSAAAADLTALRDGGQFLYK